MSISAIGSVSLLNASTMDILSSNSTEINSLSNEDSATSFETTSSYRQSLPPDPELSERELQQKAYLSYLEQYIKSYGAPEELDRSSNNKIEPILEDEKEKLKKKAKESFNPDALETKSKTIQDPEHEDKIKVVVSKADEDGKFKITRIMTFGPKEGKNNNDDTNDENISKKEDSDANKNDGHSSSVTKEEKV